MAAFGSAAIVLGLMHKVKLVLILTFGLGADPFGKDGVDLLAPVLLGLLYLVRSTL